MTAAHDRVGRMGEGVRTSGPILLLAAATLLAWPLAGALQYDRDRIVAGEFWRFATCQWTHWSVDHLLWDVAVFVALGIACARRGLATTLATIALAALAVPLAVHVACPAIATFRGLSGVDSALFGLAVARLGFERRGRWVPLALAAAFVAKVAYESTTGATLFSAGGFVVVPMAHGVGVATGVAVGSLATIPRSRRACSPFPARPNGEQAHRLRGESTVDCPRHPSIG